ncbi:MAG: RnfABCDGE type electron transport complex subunit D [Clostridia bacterium]|nr:RnfABCDGE type electron transport complex subunit D [Clostridia bacterium]
MIDGKLLHVSASPHFRSKATTKSIMLDVIIALLPSLIASVVIFGLRALLVTIISVATCVLSEYVFRKLLKRSNTITDLSAVVTGLLLAFNMPSGIPLWMVAIGGVFAIVIVKQCFGGIGQNFVNPAIAGRIFMLLSFGKMMEWSEPMAGIMNITGVEAISGATPLAVMSSGEGLLPSLMDMFLGIRGGCLGETCIAAIILGGIYLVARKVIKPVIPLSYIGTVAVIMIIVKFTKGSDWSFVAYQLMSGGLFLGAVFMATDYTTSPITFTGKIIFGVGCGLLTCLIRLFGSLPEGVSYSIILMNVLCPLIERYTTPKPFGTPKKEKKEGEAKA